VDRACRLLEVSRSAFYARRNSPSKRSVADATLTAEIRQIHAMSKGTYGSPRVHAELVEGGHEIGRRRVTRLMCQAGIEGRHKRRWRKTTVVDPGAERARDWASCRSPQSRLQRAGRGIESHRAIGSSGTLARNVLVDFTLTAAVTSSRSCRSREAGQGLGSTVYKRPNDQINRHGLRSFGSRISTFGPLFARSFPT